LTEALARHQDINILGEMEKSEKYLEILNTFEGLSNGVICNHPPLTTAQNIEPDENKRYSGKILPIYHMVFSNKKINQEIYEILTLKIQHFHANLTEKEKITRYLKVFLQEIMRLANEEGENYDVVFEEDKLLAIVGRIQSKIFDKTFSFNAKRIEEAEKKNLEETIYVAVEEARKNKEGEVKEEDETTKAEKSTVKSGAGGETTNGAASQKMMEEEVSPKKRRKGEKKEVKQDSDSEDVGNFREMEYATQDSRNIDLFEPIPRSNEVFFYGTQNLYYLVRFYYTLYERFLKVQEISSFFEENPRSKLLTPEDKEELAKERYDIFKWVLAHLIRSNLESEKYEDLLRCVFGNKAYLMFYVDRIVHMFIITIQKLMNDDISVKTLNLFTETELPNKNADTSKFLKPVIKKPKNWPEYIHLAHINQLTLDNMNSLQTTTFFRFVYDPKDYIITVNIYDSAYKGWNEKILDTIYDYTEWYRSANLTGNHLASSINTVFLERNKNKNKNRYESDSVRIIQSNHLEWKYVPNTTKLVTDGLHREDFMHAVPTKKLPSMSLTERVKLQYKRMKRFQEWNQDVLKNMNAK